jgi:hypothetical protein
MPRRFAIVLAVLLTACAGSTPSSTLPSSDANAAPAAEDVEGPFHLEFTLPRTTWSAGESIEGQSQLSLVGGERVTIVGSGAGVLGFGFAEVGGHRQMGPAWRADCAIHVVAADRPIVSPIRKSGGYSDDQPDAAFYRAFFGDPLVHLPVGEWDITAVAEFAEQECGGPAHALEATIRVRVTE